MSASGFTPISLYYSTTASAVPTAANLVPGELAINTADGKLYYEDSSGVVQVLATKSTGSIGGSNTQVQFNNSGSLGGSSGLTWDGSFLTAASIKDTALTSGRVTYAGASGLLSDSANLTFDGTSLTTPRLVLGGTTLPSAGTATLFSRTSDNNTYLQTGSGNNFNLLDGSQNTMATFSPTALNFNISNTAKLTLNSTTLYTASGVNVGIGTSSPTTFSVGGSPILVVGNNAQTQITLYGGSNVGDINFATSSSGTGLYSGVIRYDGTSNFMSFWTSSTERMRIDSSGNLLIGKTSATLSGAGAWFEVPGDITTMPMYLHFCKTFSGLRDAVDFNYSGTRVGSIQFSDTATLYNVTSDQRVKTNIVNAPSGNIDDIKVRSFDWIADGSHQEYGMVAQELIEVAPYAVSKPENPDEMMGVDYSKLVPMMIKEIQELKQRITNLENK